MNCAETEPTDCEELDYEGENVNGPKKSPPITSEKDDDVEEGEILDADHKDCQKYKCAFFQTGKCARGDICRFLHVKDEGFYKMLDSSPLPPPPPQPPLFLFPNVIYPVGENFGPCETASTAWDLALLKAKQRIKAWDTKMNRGRKPIVITIESDDEKLPTKSTEKPRRYKSPEPNISNNSVFSGPPEQKSVKKKNEWCREVKWNDPCRRSLIPFVKRSRSKRRHKKSSSPDSQRRSQSPRRPRQMHRSISERSCEIVKNRHKPVTRQSSSSSSSQTSMCHSKKKRVTKQEDTKQKQKKSSFSIGDELHKDSKTLELASKKLLPSSFGSYLLKKTRNKISFPLKNQHKESPVPLKRMPLSFNSTSDILENKVSSPVEDEPTKSLEPLKKKSPPLSFTPDILKKPKNKVSSPVEDKPTKSFEPLKKVSPSLSPKGDAQQWIPKEIQFPTAVRSCSDMSISPLSDSSLSDLFDPVEKDDSIDRPWRPWQTSRSQASTTRKKHQGEVYGPAVPPGSELLNSSKVTSKIVEKDGTVNPPAEKSRETPPTKKMVTKNKAEDPKPKQVKKRNIRSLEGDLMKFHRGYDFENQPSSTVEKEKLPKKTSGTIQKSAVSAAIHNFSQRVEAETRRMILSRELSRKEVLLKQLKAIDAAIERKKRTYETQK